MTAEYDEDQEMWRPLPRPRANRENHIIVFLHAEEFCTIAVGSSENTELDEKRMEHNFDIYINQIRQHYPGHTLIFLIQGLASWIKRNLNVKNREYAAAVRSQAVDSESDPPAPSQKQRRGQKRRSNNNASTQKPDFSLINAEISEALLLHLQLSHQPLHIHHTTSHGTTAHEISQFTQHLSTRPYRITAQTHNLTRASFCMDIGQIRTSADAKETYLSMLQEVNRITPSMAIGISAAGYDSVRKLVEGFRGEEGSVLLEDVKKALNRDGGWSDRRLGPMVSKRLYKVFMGKDPGSMDGMA